MSDTTPLPSLVLVTGGTGKTGSRVANRLRAAGVETRIGSRSARIPFDWTDRTTWGPALSGADAAYIAFQPDLAVPGAPEALEAFTAAPVHSGVRRLVLLSGRGEPEARECEQIVRDSGLDWSIVRSPATRPDRAARLPVRHRPGRQDFSDYVRATAASDVWDPAN